LVFLSILYLFTWQFQKATVSICQTARIKPATPITHAMTPKGSRGCNRHDFHDNAQRGGLRPTVLDVETHKEEIGTLNMMEK
jgi:hypothetical protein